MQIPAQEDWRRSMRVSSSVVVSSFSFSISPPSSRSLVISSASDIDCMLLSLSWMVRWRLCNAYKIDNDNDNFFFFDQRNHSYFIVAVVK